MTLTHVTLVSTEVNFNMWAEASHYDVTNHWRVPEREPTHHTGHIDADNYYERRLSVTSQRKPAFPAISHTRRLEEMCATAALGTTSQSTLFTVTEQSFIHRPYTMYWWLALTTVDFTFLLRFCTFLWLSLLYLHSNQSLITTMVLHNSHMLYLGKCVDVCLIVVMLIF